MDSALLRRLVDGEHAKRYIRPSSDLYIIFPYEVSSRGARLLSESEIQGLFPTSWEYLKQHEVQLRQRESGAFDDTTWYRFGRDQNIDKQHLPKIGIAQTVTDIQAFFDEEGSFCFHNVRVNAVIDDRPDRLWYLLACINGPVFNYAFKRGARPKDNGFFEANKQFIEALPIPNVENGTERMIALKAKELQELHTKRRDSIERLQRRLESNQTVLEEKPPQWLWADIHNLEFWTAKNPGNLTGRSLSSWAREQVKSITEGHYEEIQDLMRPGIHLDVVFEDGELVFRLDEARIATCYLDPNNREAEFFALQWRQVARQFVITDKTKAESLVRELLSLRKTDNVALIEQSLEIDKEIHFADSEIARQESALNEKIYELYQLTDEERKRVDAG